MVRSFSSIFHVLSAQPCPTTAMSEPLLVRHGHLPEEEKKHTTLPFEPHNKKRLTCMSNSEGLVKKTSETCIQKSEKETGTINQIFHFTHNNGQWTKESHRIDSPKKKSWARFLLALCLLINESPSPPCKQEANSSSPSRELGSCSFANIWRCR